MAWAQGEAAWAQPPDSSTALTHGSFGGVGSTGACTVTESVWMTVDSKFPPLIAFLTQS
ncbi:hypothetical protein [Streptomyces paromomycinus]|uniref:Uncharacterized protein n=1 Tax=Streptomyces paromomycinus TaxID=92743 RepID=A0A401W444_STREY|nr:hypothetical protein [Streptomyces paromomycinus]GCD44094.1 hypothetical protein GKJPGBOP_03783 [Streptomyces paromomycinus]